MNRFFQTVFSSTARFSAVAASAVRDGQCRGDLRRSRSFQSLVPCGSSLTMRRSALSDCAATCASGYKKAKVHAHRDERSADKVVRCGQPLGTCSNSAFRIKEAS